MCRWVELDPIWNQTCLIISFLKKRTLKQGWSELAATNAPVADEPVEAVFRMNENPILPAQIFYFFSTSSLPQNFPPLLPTTSLPPPTYHLPPPSYLPPPSPLLPTTYLPPPTYHLPTPPPSLHRQSSKDVERERAWSLERLEPLPCRTQVSIFFFVFILFVCLWSCTAQDTQRCSAAPQTTFASSSSLCCKKRRRRRRCVQRKKFQRIRARSSELLLFVSLFFFLFLLAPLRFF